MSGDLYDDPFAYLLGDSQSMQIVRVSARKLAAKDMPVLLTGETGTGKKLLARVIHAFSRSKKGPFVAVDCAAMSKELQEVEFFGSEKGAIAGIYNQHRGHLELAHNGTLFLESVAGLPMTTQARLARFIDEPVIQRVGGRERIAVNVRVLASAEKTPTDDVKDSQFRYDLYLHFATIHLPPLRERKEDIPLLANVFLTRYAKEQRVRVHGFTDDAQDAMASHSWPINVRELESRIKRAIVLTEGPRITVKDLGLEVLPTGHSQPRTLKEAREALEKELILGAFSRHGGNLTNTAEELGISRPTLYGLMEKLNILRKNWPPSPVAAKVYPPEQHSREPEEKADVLEHLSMGTELSELPLLSHSKYAAGEPAKEEPPEKIEEKTLVSDEPDAVKELSSRALLCKKQGKYAEAERLFRKSLEVAKDALGPEHPTVADILENMSAIFRATGHKGAADEVDKRVAAIRESKPLL